MKKLFVLVLALVMAMAALPAFAQDKADWAFYGNARMWTSWESVDEKTLNLLSSGSGSRAGAWTATGVTGSPNQDDSEIDWKLQTNSRIGANVKWGNIGGRFEYGSGPNLRLLYGTWNFGPGTLLVGQDYTPWFYLVSGMCGPGGGECNGIGLGSIYGGRNGQLKLIMGGFQFALVTPYSSVVPQTESSTYAAFTTETQYLNSLASPISSAFTPLDTDQTLPKIEASYSFSLGPASLWLGGLYQTYQMSYVSSGAIREVDIDTWLVGLGAKTAFGPLYVNATVQYGENPNNGPGPYATLIPAYMFHDTTDNKDFDSTYLAAQLIIGFKVMDNFSLEGGVIYQNGDLDIDSDSVEQTVMTYYLQAVFSPAKNVFIVPEVGLIDYGDLEATGLPDKDLGDLTYFGIKWQINF